MLTPLDEADVERAMDEIERQGVAAVFQPGASLEEIVGFIRSSVAA